MTLTIWGQIGIIAAASVLVMAMLWFVQRRTGDAGIVDVGWSYLLGAAAVFAALTADGSLVYRVLIATLVGVWSLRLGTHILVDRVLSGAEDGRYTMLRDKVGGRIQPILFLFYQFQAVLVPVLSLPYVTAASIDHPTLAWTAYLGAVVWTAAIVGEWIADRQLKAFKRDPDSKGKTCRRGLWNYSRHPNYFFEWFTWVGYALIALGSDLWYLAWAAPALMLLLILKVTGIPPTEARAVISRGDDYREYQRTTSAFVPWPKNTPPFAGRATGAAT